MSTQLAECEGSWRHALDCVQAKGGDSYDLTIAGPAKVKQVEKIERQIGTNLPRDFVQTVTTYSQEVGLFWSLERDSLPDELEGVQSGDGMWDLTQIVDGYERIRDVRLDEEIEDELEYRLISEKMSEADCQKFRETKHVPFWAIDNGDYICFEIGELHEGNRIVHLDLDSLYSPFGATFLAPSFTEYVLRRTSIGCAGPEPCYMSPFLDKNEGIQTNCAAAKKWRTWLLGELE